MPAPTEPTLTEIREQIAEAIRKDGRAQRQIAIEAGVVYSTLNSFLTGHHDPPLWVIVKLADFFGMELILRPKRKTEG